MAEEDELLTLTVAAEETGLTARRLRQLAQSGQLGATLYGKTYVVSRKRLHQFMAEYAPKPGRPRKSSRPTPPQPPAQEG